jgi:hypothetical protein
MNRTLILSCSQSKKFDQNDLPAIERYDGPAFRLLRRYLNRSHEDLEIYILSAKFGLIKHQTSIPYYEQKLRSDGIEELKEQISMQFFFSETQERKPFFINLGKTYLQVFEPVFEGLVKNPNTTFASGSSGKRLAEMYDWLYGEKSALRNEQAKIKLEKEVFIQGVRLDTTEKEIRVIVQKELRQNGMKEMQNFQSWFVPIDDLKVSPKWLISRLTDLPVGRFHSDQARKVLQKLSIKVQRV